MGSQRDDPFVAGLTAGQRFAELRTVPRYPLTWTVELFEPIEQTRFAAHTEVVSIKGCRIRVPVSLGRNTIVRLHIQWRQELVDVWARVTGTTPGGPEGFTMGIAFLGDKHEEAVAQWISAEMSTP